MFIKKTSRVQFKMFRKCNANVYFLIGTKLYFEYKFNQLILRFFQKRMIYCPNKIFRLHTLKAKMLSQY